VYPYLFFDLTNEHYGQVTRSLELFFKSSRTILEASLSVESRVRPELVWRTVGGNGAVKNSPCGVGLATSPGSPFRCGDLDQIAHERLGWLESHEP
jgi:hypothetical protein